MICFNAIIDVEKYEHHIYNLTELSSLKSGFKRLSQRFDEEGIENVQ